MVMRRRRTRFRRPVVGLLVVAVLVAAGLAGFASWPKSLVLVDARTGAGPVLRQLSQSYLVENAGWNDARIRSIDESVAGVELIATSVGTGVIVPAHTSRWLQMTFRVDDCTSPPYGPLPVNLRVQRWYGTQTVTVRDQGADFDDARTACSR